MSSTSDTPRALSGVIEFAFEFVKRMRERQDLMTPPSIRQSQSIPKLLSSRYFRNGNITHEDFVEVAIYTTNPEDQEIAKEIAEDIVLGSSSRKKKREAPKFTPQPTMKEDALEAMVKKIRRERDMARGVKTEDVTAGSEYLDDLMSRKDTPKIEAALKYLSEGDIVLKGITDDDELQEAAIQELLDRFGGLTSTDMTNADALDILDKIEKAPNAAEQLTAAALRGDKEIKKKFKQLADHDSSTAARALRHMEELDVLSPSDAKEMDDILQSSLRDLSDVSEYVKELKRLPDNLTEHIHDATKEFPLIDSLEFSKSIRDETGQDFAEEIMDAYDTHYDEGAAENVDMGQLSDAYRNGEPWKSLLEKETESIIEQSKSRSSAADYLRSHLQEMAQLQTRLSDSQMEEHWKPSMQKMADTAVGESPTKSHLRDTVRIASQQGVTPSADVVQKTAEQLGMTDLETQEILSPSFEIIEKLIKEGNSGYDRLHHLLQSANLDYDQLKELADLAADEGHKEALSAIASINLQAGLGRWQGKMMKDRTFQYKGKVSEDRATQTVESLSSGPATSVIKAWFHHRNKVPKEIRHKLKEIAKQLLIDMGSQFAKQTMGTSMLGGLQESTTVRPYRLGDDTDMINLEETMSALLAQGHTRFDVLEYDDFLVTQPYHGHRAFFWALDKSKSMESAEKLGMLALSVMAGLYGIKKDDFGVVLFDHETHVVKQIPQRNISPEEVSEKLLEITASGGTGAARSMRLAITNLDESKAREKFFILSSDAFLSDQEECEELAKQMKQKGIKVILIVPESSYDIEATQSLANASRGSVIDLSSIQDLPKKLLAYTNY